MESINIGKIIGFALGIYVVAYVLLDAVLAVANKSGFVAGSSLATLATTVIPILSMIGGVWLIYKFLSGKYKNFHRAWLFLPIIVLLLFSGTAGADFTQVDTLTAGAGENSFHSAVIDSTNTFAYFGTGNVPGKIVKVQLSDFTQVGTLTAGVGQNSFFSAVIDSTNTFVYFGTSTSPGKIVKIQLSDFTQVGTLTAGTGENDLESAVIDSTNTFAYFGTTTIPAKIIKVQLSNFTQVGTLTAGAGANFFYSAVIDSTNTYAYFGTGDVPGKIVKVQLSDFTQVGTLTAGVGQNSFYSAVIDSTNTFAYFGDTGNSNIIKVQLSDFTQVGTLTTGTGAALLRAVIDSTDTFAYFGSLTSPGKIFKVQLSNFTQVETLTAGSGENTFYSAVIDSTNTYAYFGTETSPGKIVKVDVSQQPISYDPSGYVNDTAGNPLFNVKVTLANATFNTTAYTNLNGYWNTNIYADGNYNYNVSLNGYTTLSGTQAFTMGQTNANFTLSANKARLYGTVYEWTNESGSKSITGDLKSLKSIFSGYKKYKIYAGASLTLPKAPDGKTYVLKNKDVDISGNSAIIQILESGNVKFEEYVEKNKDYRYKVSETSTIEQYLVVKIGDIFSSTSSEISWIEVSPGFDIRQKSTVSKWDLIYYWHTYFNSGLLGIVVFFIDVAKWLDMSPNDPDTMVTFNALAGADAEAENIFDFSGDTQITTIFVGIRTKNDGNPGKIGYGFTDDDIEVAPGYKDVTIQTGSNEYISDYRKFSDIDTDGDKKVKVWIYFYEGYGSKWGFNYYVTGFCTGCNLKPLADASIYQSFNNNTKSNTIGFYNLYVPFGTYNISYSKDGYESKSYSFTFNAANNVNNTDVILNKSTMVITEPVHYVKVLPNPSTSGNSISAYYKTLNTYSYYKISICPFNDEVNCLDEYGSVFGVAPNKESFVPLKTYSIGTYTVYLSGKNFFDWSWTIVAYNNFTIISSIPTAAWEASTYYLGETMKVNVYIPSGSETLTIYYPNSTVLFTGIFSSATTVQNKTFTTNNLSTAGKYLAEITGNGNISLTELLPISASNYSLSAPTSVVWGNSFTVQYISPKTSELTITKSDGNLAYTSKTVSGSKSVIFNTSSLENKADTLTIQLIQQGNIIKASTKITIGSYTAPITGDASVSKLGDNLRKFMAMPAFWGLVFTILLFYAIGKTVPQSMGFGMFLILNVEAIIGLWAPYTAYILAVTWIFAGIYFSLGRKVLTGG